MHCENDMARLTCDKSAFACHKEGLRRVRNIFTVQKSGRNSYYHAISLKHLDGGGRHSIICFLWLLNNRQQQNYHPKPFEAAYLARIICVGWRTEWHATVAKRDPKSKEKC